MNPCLLTSYWWLPWVEAAWKPEAGATGARLRSASLGSEQGSRWWGLALEARGGCPAHTSLHLASNQMLSTLEGTVLSPCQACLSFTISWSLLKFNSKAGVFTGALSPEWTLNPKFSL